MNLERDPEWASAFIQSRQALSAHERNDLLRRTARGELVRIIPGIYLPADVAVGRSARRRHRDLVLAHVLRSPAPPLFSHASAAALWRLPRVGGWPPTVHIVGPRASGGRSTHGVTRHSIGIPHDEACIDGIRVTTLPRTVVDLARVDSHQNAVVAADAALAGCRIGSTLIRTSRRELGGVLATVDGRGSAAARSVIAFANGAAGSPGESLSRVAIARDRLTAPVLQNKFSDEFGDMFVDFFWPENGVIGEFDGVGKYLREEWMDGRSSGQVVVDEKWREDRLRGMGFRVVRWGWDLVQRPGALTRLLRASGVR